MSKFDRPLLIWGVRPTLEIINSMARFAEWILSHGATENNS